MPLSMADPASSKRLDRTYGTSCLALRETPLRPGRGDDRRLKAHRLPWLVDEGEAGTVTSPREAPSIRPVWSGRGTRPR